jgi:predicted DNA-binding transcriptional regulator AlpA
VTTTSNKRKLAAARGRVAERQAPDRRPAAPAQVGPPLLLSRDDLKQHYGIRYTRSHLHRLMRDGKFPRQVSLGPESYARKAWRRQDIETWVANLPVSTGTDEGAEREA